jgi:P27 family predicted phage terminase small subunit
MGKRGPIPKPTAIKILDGTRRDRINTSEPPAVAGDPQPPPHLAGPALAEWRRILPIIKKTGVLSKIDGAMLSIYCEAYARWLDATAALKRYGLVTPTAGNSVKPSPYLAIEREAVAVMRVILSEFGGSPSSRTRIKAEGPAEVNRLDRFIKG